jgi:hypothetical protein
MARKFGLVIFVCAVFASFAMIQPNDFQVMVAASATEGGDGDKGGGGGAGGGDGGNGNEGGSQGGTGSGGGKGS